MTHTAVPAHVHPFRPQPSARPQAAYRSQTAVQQQVADGITR